MRLFLSDPFHIVYLIEISDFLIIVVFYNIVIVVLNISKVDVELVFFWQTTKVRRYSYSMRNIDAKLFRSFGIYFRWLVYER